MQQDREEKKEEQKPPSKEVRELLTWESASRPFKKRDSKYFVNIGLILVLVAAIAIFFQEFLFLAVLLALFFYFYVAGTVEPEKISHRITNQGITTANHSYTWGDLTDFWYTEKYGEVILTVGSKLRFPGRLIMIVPYIDREKAKKILVEYLPYREKVPTTPIDELVEWIYTRMPQSLR